MTIIYCHICNKVCKCSVRGEVCKSNDSRKCYCAEHLAKYLKEDPFYGTLERIKIELSLCYPNLTRDELTILIL